MAPTIALSALLERPSAQMHSLPKARTAGKELKKWLTILSAATFHIIAHKEKGNWNNLLHVAPVICWTCLESMSNKIETHSSPIFICYWHLQGWPTSSESRIHRCSRSSPSRNALPTTAANPCAPWRPDVPLS